MHLPSGLKRPSAVLPLAMSACALAVVVAHLVFVGTAREADEGAAAHLFQLLMAAQVPIVAYFGLRWLPTEPRETLQILALQASAALAALAPVYILNL